MLERFACMKEGDERRKERASGLLTPYIPGMGTHNEGLGTLSSVMTHS